MYRTGAIARVCIRSGELLVGRQSDVDLLRQSGASTGRETVGQCGGSTPLRATRQLFISKLVGAIVYYLKTAVDISDETLARLRPGQHAAVRAMQAWALSGEPQKLGLLVLPTGYGKSELIALAPFLFGARRSLIVAPTQIIREQLAVALQRRDHLVEAGIVPNSPSPKVLARRNVLASVEAWKSLRAYDTVVAHPRSISPAVEGVSEPNDPKLFDLLVFDEAHHLGAPSWRHLTDTFPDAMVVGFTATPYRRDRRSLEESVILEYPVAKAVAEGYFAPITYRQIVAGPTRDDRDRAVAQAAISELGLRDKKYGRAARLLVRSDTIDRAEQLVDLYRDLSGDEVTLECITHKTSRTKYIEAINRLQSGGSAGVSFVGVLGEGFNLATLKIAAYHAAHRSLPATVQFAGRVARGSVTGEAAVLIAAEDDHPEVVRALHQDDQRWDLLIPSLAEQLRTVPVRAWVESTDDEENDIRDAFTAANARFFRLADVWVVDEPIDPEEIRARVDGETFSVSVVGEASGLDSARCVSSLNAPTAWAGLFERHRPTQWLAYTPPAHLEYATMIVATVPRADGKQWLFVRSTLGDALTDRILDHVLGVKRTRPSKAVLARFGQWTTARLTSLGKRSLHPVVAGVQSYETGAGEDVAAAVTADDRAMKEAGHLIGVHGTAAARRQLGLALGRRRLWQTGLASISDYVSWVEDVAAELSSETQVKQLAGLQIGDARLDPYAQPVGVVLDSHPSSFDLTYRDTADNPHLLADAVITTTKSAGGGPIEVRFSDASGTSAFLTLEYEADGQLRPVLGFIERLGHQTESRQWFERHPPQVFFNDGSILRGSGGCTTPSADALAIYFPIGTEPRKLRTDSKLNITNRVLTVDRSVARLSEKPAGNQGVRFTTLSAVTGSTINIGSLFEWITKTARAHGADFIYCDDGSGEVADFIIGWQAHGSAQTPTVRLVHAKAASSALRAVLSTVSADPGSGTTLKSTEEVAQQALRSVDFLNMPPSHQLRRLVSRAEQFNRWLVGSAAVAESILDSPRRTNEIRIVHPGLDYTKLAGSAHRVRTLLGAIRSRAQASRAELSVVVRHCP